MITQDQFSAMIPTNRESDQWYQIAVDMFKKYDITSTNRIAGFMAQCAHESRDFNSLEENLNYSVDALNRVFSRYFGPGKRNAVDYARNPQKLANYVYMDQHRTKRGALGNTQPGDGWRFRGGGIKQLTGRNNYTVFAKDIGMTPESAADYVRTKKGAFESACWFWSKNNIARFADRDDIDGMSKAINGGTIGIEDRRSRYHKAKRILGGNFTAVQPKNGMRTLRRGMEGNDVKKMQKILGITADGIFGFGTATAVKKWQRANGLAVDGIVGPNTQAKMFKYK